MNIYTKDNFRICLLQLRCPEVFVFASSRLKIGVYVSQNGSLYMKSDNSAANFQAGHLIFGHNPQDRYSRLSVKIMRGKKKLPCTEPLSEEKLGQRSKQEPSL